jgi:molybdopterin molybdotransferase
MISIEEAWEKIASRCAALPIEERDLSACGGRVLAEPVMASMDLPPFDNSAMDGYALRAADTLHASEDKPVRLAVSGEVAAGCGDTATVESGAAISIMTGAAIPPGADAVLMLEAARLRAGFVEIRQPVDTGRHVRRKGEDVRRGSELLAAGRRLGPGHLALLANSGVARVKVYQRPRVAILATGSELVAAGGRLEHGKIFDSNRITLSSLLEQEGIRGGDLGIAQDDPERIAEKIRQGLAGDMLLISGGVSVGKHDHVKTVLAKLGMETVFWRVSMKPGKPILCGRCQDTWIFGLPGNPISCVVGFLVFVQPLLGRMQGQALAHPRFARARLLSPVRKQDGRRHFLTAAIALSPDGFLEAMPTHKQGSAMMESLAQADGFVIVPEQRDSIEAGETVDVLLMGR